MIVRFTIEPHACQRERKAWDSNPHAARSGSALAVRPGEPYPATFRMSVDPLGIEPRFPACRAGAVPFGMSPRV